MMEGNHNVAGEKAAIRLHKAFRLSTTKTEKCIVATRLNNAGVQFGESGSIHYEVHEMSKNVKREQVSGGKVH